MKLIDTDIIIDFSRGRVQKGLLRLDGSECISDVTYMEFLQGCRNIRELDLWKRFSRRFRLLPVSEDISQRARYLMEGYYLSHGMQMGDALIAATALNHALTLITANKKHFHFVPGLAARFIVHS